MAFPNRHVGIYQDKKKKHPPFFDIELKHKVIDHYDCLGSLPLSLELRDSHTPGRDVEYVIARKGDAWHTADRKLHGESEVEQAPKPANELARRQWWRQTNESDLEAPAPATKNPNASEVARTLTELSRLTQAVDSLSSSEIVAIRTGQQHPHPTTANGQTGSFDDDDSNEIADLMNEYMRTHHIEFVRWANRQVEKKTMDAREVVKMLHDTLQRVAPSGRG